MFRGKNGKNYKKDLEHTQMVYMKRKWTLKKTKFINKLVIIVSQKNSKRKSRKKLKLKLYNEIKPKLTEVKVKNMKKIANGIAIETTSKEEIENKRPKNNVAEESFYLKLKIKRTTKELYWKYVTGTLK